MEHIVQFGVTIDDHAIEKQVMNSVTNAMTEELKKQIFNKYYGTYEGLNSATQALVVKFLENNKDAIIAASAEIIANKMYASKNVRGKILETLKEKEVSK